MPLISFWGCLVVIASNQRVLDQLRQPGATVLLHRLGARGSEPQFYLCRGVHVLRPQGNEILCIEDCKARILLWLVW